MPFLNLCNLENPNVHSMKKVNQLLWLKGYLSYFLLSFTLLLFWSCGVKTPLTLNEGSIRNEIHQQNIGRIAFMSEWVPFEHFTNADFTDELTLTNDSEFGFRMFLGKTLTYYLSLLQPNAPINSLCENGNFQLTFYVDDQEVYQNNLQPGAGSCDYKNTATVYGIPFVNKSNPDHWGRFLWTKFMHQGGGQNLLSKGKHRFKIEVRPYLKLEEIEVGDIIAEGEVLLNIVDKEIEANKLAVQKIAPTSLFAISNEKYDTLIIRNLNKKIAQNLFKNITSLVVLKNGELLIEEYFNGATRTTTHDTRSVGKSLASTLLGSAIKDGHIVSINSTLEDYYALDKYENYSEIKTKITLENLLTMSSGLEGSDMDPNSSGNEENMYPTSDWVRFALNLPINPNKIPGKDWQYFTAGVVILGDILNKSVPGGLEKYAHENLFQPLNIQNYKWQFTPTNVPNTAGGFEMTSLDNAIYGQLYLNGGQYNGRQIISEEWAKESLSPHIKTSISEEEHYGYLFWQKEYNVDNRKYNAYYASGNGGNKIIMFQELGVVVVLTATAYGQPYMHAQADQIIQEYILPAILKI